MINEHATAFLALLTADPELNVYDGAPPDETKPPYVVVWISVDSESDISISAEQGMANLRYTTHSIGASGLAARRIADRVRNAVLGQRMTIDGRRPFKIRHEYGVPPQWEESTGYEIVDVVDVWTCQSALAPA